MTKFEQAVLAAAKTFISVYASAEVSAPTTGAPTPTSNGIPVCPIHGKALAVSKTPRDVTKDYYYCQTKDEATGKWCRTKAGKAH